MTQNIPKAPPYPKSHILAASGVAALLSLALLVFPSREVEAQKTFLDLDLGNDAEMVLQEKDDLRAGLPVPGAASPFAKIEQSADTAENSAEDADENLLETADTPPPSDPNHHNITVSNGDTLSTVFAKVGLSANDLHEALNSHKDAKQFSRLKVGQVLEFELNEDGTLKNLQSKLSDLETIRLSRTDNGFDFQRDQVNPEVVTTYSRGVINSSLFITDLPIREA